MADRFDPYLHWLGIRDPERPPNHYRLLGVALFEDDPDVLTNAADRQMSHVRTFQTGRHSAESQKLLNELAGAKVCLLNAAKKAAYDAKLRAEQARGAPAPPRAPLPVEPPAPPPIEPPPAGDAASTAGPSGVLLVTPIPTPAPRPPKAIAPAPRSSSSVALLLALLGVLVLLVLGLIFLLRNVDALREKLTESLGIPTASPDNEEVRAPDREPPSKPETQPRPTPAKPQAEVKPPAGAKLPAEPQAKPEPKPEPKPQPRPEPRPEPKPKPEPARPEPAAAGHAGVVPGQHPPPGDARLEVPAADAQSAALKVIRELFQERYAAREREQRRAFARFLQQKAADTRDNPAARYVLYLEARDMAVAAGDAGLLLGVLQDLGRQYRLDRHEMVVDTLIKAAKRPRDSPSNQSLARLALETARGEMAKENYDSATLLCEAAKEMARKAGDGATVKQIVSLLKDVTERKQALAAFLELPAEKRSGEDSGDPQVNWIAARYYCLVKGDWPRGLALVLRSDEAGLRDAAQSELAHPPVSTAQMVAAGDHWYDASRTADELGRRFARGRAIYWYQRTVHSVSGLTRSKVERRLAELSK